MSLIIHGVSKSYGTLPALTNLNVTLEKGEIVGLLGPNGAGKSTLMKILTGFISNWEGHIHFDNINLKENPQKIQQRLGYLPENNPLYPEMYIKEYLQFVAKLYRVRRPPIRETILKTGLESHQNQKIETLSKGYRQRVGIAAALLHDPEILILDEPTTGLDPNQIIEIRKLIDSLKKEKTILLSTHILQEVDALCDRVLIIKKGEIVMNSTLDSLRSNQEQIVEVAFDYRIEPQALEQIEHVSRVVNTHDFEYALHFRVTEDMRAAVFDFAHDNGLKILKLQLKNKNLEACFHELTQD